jgi:hypothetical protein
LEGAVRQGIADAEASGDEEGFARRLKLRNRIGGWKGLLLLWKTAENPNLPPAARAAS